MVSKQRDQAIEIAFSSAVSIQDICRPLFTNFGLNYFDFFRGYNDGSRVYLSSSLDWLNYQLQQKYWHTPNFEILIPNSIRHLPWSDITNFMPKNEGMLFEEKHKDAYRHFDFCNGIALIDRSDDYTDFYNFSAGKHNDLIFEIYLKKISVFERFILYFREIANPIIQQATANRFGPINNGESLTNGGKAQINSELDFKIDQFIAQTPLNRLYFANIQTYLTKQEANCLKLLCSGLAVKQIAHRLGISARSAEYYIANIKNKLKCNRQSELTAIAKAFNFFEAF